MGYSVIFFLSILLAVPPLHAGARPDADTAMVKRSSAVKAGSKKPRARHTRTKGKRPKGSAIGTPTPQENVTDQIEVSQQADKIGLRKR
jgi:hypothetical protein